MSTPHQNSENLNDSDSDENDSVTAFQNINVKRREDGSSGIDFEDEIVRGMTASYTEISFNTQSSEPDDSILEDNNITGSLQETESTSEFRETNEDCEEQLEFKEKPKKLEESNYERPSQLSLGNDIEKKSEVNDFQPKPKAVGYLNQLNGTVTQEGDLVLFVAEDLENKIKLSSPVGKKDDDLSIGSGMSSWGNSGWLCRQSLVDQFPVMDASILNELEIEVGKIATSVDNLTENLAEILHSVSALTVDCLETYRDVVCKTCDAVDLNIKSMYQLMAKCEELSKSMKPIYKLSQHVKEMKHFLDLLENASN